MAERTRSEGISLDFQPMSPDERDRMMQFLLTQQTQFAADLAKSQERSDAEMAKLSAKTDRIADGLIGLTGIVGTVVRTMGDLATAQTRTEEQLRQTDARLRESDARLTTHIDRVESHLNVVIDMFERHLREDHGHPPIAG